MGGITYGGVEPAGTLNGGIEHAESSTLVWLSGSNIEWD